MELWVFVTVLAAAAQTVRFGLMRRLKTTELSSVGATFSRYLYSAPLAVFGVLAYGAAVQIAPPAMTPAYMGYLVAGGGAQILATVCVMSLFARRSFAVGMAFINTTVLMAVFVGWVWLGDTVSGLGFVAIVLGALGVLLLSDTGPRGAAADDAQAPGWAARVFNRGAALGLGAGFLFAVAGVGYRGAVLEMGAIDATYRALYTLAIATFMQIAVMAAWMVWRDAEEVVRVLRAWRIAGLVGLCSMIGSTCWFIAFALQNVAYVNAVGQIEILFSIGLSVFVFKETVRAREWQGGGLLMGSILILILAG